MKVRRCPFCGLDGKYITNYRDRAWHVVIGCSNEDCDFQPQKTFTGVFEDETIIFACIAWNYRKKRQ